MKLKQVPKAIQDVIHRRINLAPKGVISEAFRTNERLLTSCWRHAGKLSIVLLGEHAIQQRSQRFEQRCGTPLPGVAAISHSAPGVAFTVGEMYTVRSINFERAVVGIGLPENASVLLVDVELKDVGEKLSFSYEIRCAFVTRKDVSAYPDSVAQDLEFLLTRLLADFIETDFDAA